MLRRVPMLGAALQRTLILLGLAGLALALTTCQASPDSSNTYPAGDSRVQAIDSQGASYLLPSEKLLARSVSSQPATPNTAFPAGNPADLFAGPMMQTGIIGTTNQAIFGPEGCTAYGDPYTPNEATGNGGAFNEWWAELQGTYRYRIRVPRSYVESFDTLRVEILDPDNYNKPNQNVTVTHEDTTTEVIFMDGNRKDSRLADINDARSPNNDFWFHRIDEIRGSGSPGVCGSPSSYDPENGVSNEYETPIRFELFYYEKMLDGSTVRQELASYTSPQSPSSGVVDPHCTDLRWVSPGAAQGADYPSATCPGGVPEDSDYADVGNGDFEIALPTIDYTEGTCSGGEMPNCVIDPANDDIFVYLDVTGLDGASENGFEFWAGPDLSVYDIPTEMNDRNVHVLINGLEAAHGSQGVQVMGIGHLPLNSNSDNQVDIPLTYIGPEMAGEIVQISLFDPDAGSNGPISFFFDTIPQADWMYVTCDDDTPGAPDCDQPAGEQNSSSQHIVGGNLNNKWTDPPFAFVVPSEYDLPPTAFSGGILTASYNSGFQDTYGWFVTIGSPPGDTTPPQVTNVNTVSDTGDGSLGEGESTAAFISQLLVTFSEEVRDGTDADGAENGVNYSLVLDPGGSPSPIAIDAISYDPGSGVATLNINDGTPLGPGSYALTAVGSTSITDLAGNPLDGDGNGTGGDDFVRNFSMQPPSELWVDAQNSGGDGSFANPYQTIGEALNRAVAHNLVGVSIRIKGGTYPETATVSLDDLTFEGVDGAGSTIVCSPGVPVVVVGGVSGIVFRGLSVTSPCPPP